MKKFLRLILLIVLSLTAVCCFASCANNEQGQDEEAGVKIKKFVGDDYYTVCEYVDDGETEILDLSELNEGDVVIGRIKANVFAGNVTIKEIVVPSTVEVIDAGAFASMPKLEKLTVPFIGKTANSDASYGETEKAEDKSVDKERTFAHFFGETEFDYASQITAYYDSTNTVSYYMPMALKKVVIAPAESYSIPMYAFSDNTIIEEIELSDKIDIIGDSAFKTCVSLKKITIPTSVEKIGNSAFTQCTNLKDSGFAFATGSQLKEISDYAFMSTKLTNVVLPEGLTSLGNFAFASVSNSLSVTEVTASKLVSIVLPSTLEKINDYTFFKCENLEKVYLTAQTKTIGSQAFAYCKSLKFVGLAEEESSTLVNPTIILTNVQSAGALAFGYLGNKTFEVSNVSFSNTQDVFFETTTNL